MRYSIVFSSRTGNTRMLAEALRSSLPQEDCVYFGTPDAAALAADRIYAGFWTDKGTCDADTAAFLETLTDQQVFLFGTAGFSGSDGYYDKILARAKKHLPKTASLVGSFLCQGKMPMSVRERYEKMQKSHAPVPNLAAMIENFDLALSHPDAQDLQALKDAASVL